MAGFAWNTRLVCRSGRVLQMRMQFRAPLPLKGTGRAQAPSARPVFRSSRMRKAWTGTSIRWHWSIRVRTGWNPRAAAWWKPASSSSSPRPAACCRNSWPPSGPGLAASIVEAGRLRLPAPGRPELPVPKRREVRSALRALRRTIRTKVLGNHLQTCSSLGGSGSSPTPWPPLRPSTGWSTTRSSWSSTYPDTVTMQLSNGVRNWRWTGKTN